MKHFPLSKLTLLLAALLALVLMTAQVASAAPLKDETWKIVQSPNGSLPNGVLFDVAAISKHNVWAVGGTFIGSGWPGRNLIEHWNGSQWSTVPSPNPVPNDILFAVAAVSANDIWASGTTFPNGITAAKLQIEHWYGSQWSLVPSPSAGFAFTVPLAMAAISKNNVWAVGQTYNTSTQEQTLIEHWNGSRWSIVPSPSAGSDYGFNWMAAVSANDIWAVGFSGSATLPQTLVEHWDGSQWSVVPSPNVGTNLNSLNGVTVVSANNVWAVGDYNDSNNILHTLTEHWNGTRWSVVNSPNVGSNGSLLGTASAISANNIWTVGFYVLANGNTQTLIEHWNGSQWSVVPSPNAGGNDSLGTIAADSAGDVWAVGIYFNAANLQKTLIEHCC